MTGCGEDETRPVRTSAEASTEGLKGQQPPSDLTVPASEGRGGGKNIHEWFENVFISVPKHKTSSHHNCYKTVYWSGSSVEDLLATVWCMEAEKKKILMSSDLNKHAAKSLFMMQRKKLQQKQVCPVLSKANFLLKSAFFPTFYYSAE